MRILVFLLMGILLAAAPLASAQEERVLELNMSLGDMEPVDPCVLSGQCAIGYVYVNVTEPPPQPGITGFFAFEPIDIEGFLGEMKVLISDIVEFLRGLV